MVENTSIVVAGTKFDIGCRVILWDEIDGLSFYKTGKFSPRNHTIDELRKEINCFVLHHSVTYTAKQTYTGLIARGLSVNFIIDDDNVDGIATIYQCLDVKEAAWSHHPLNFAGSGVEISYQPTAWQTPDAYSDTNIKKFGVQPHTIVDDAVHGTTRKVFAPTDAQVSACSNLLRGYCRAFPEVKPEFPKDADGNMIKDVVQNPSGFLAHFQITDQKMDPSGFPFI